MEKFCRIPQFRFERIYIKLKTKPLFIEMLKSNLFITFKTIIATVHI